MFTDGKPFLLVPSVSSNGLQFPEGRAKTNTRHTEKGTSVRAMLFQFTEIGRSGGGDHVYINVCIQIYYTVSN